MREKIEISENRVVGLKQTRRAIKSGKAHLVYLAKDVDAPMFDEIETLCKDNQIDLVYVEDMQKLGEACGIDIKAASAAVLTGNQESNGECIAIYDKESLKKG